MIHVQNDRVDFNGIVSGDILFFHSKERLYHRLIRFFTNSTIVHVAVAVWATVEDQDILLMAEATGGGPRRLVRLRDHGGSTIEVVRSTVHWNDIRDNVLSDIGTREYSWFEAIFVGINEWSHRVYGRRLKDSLLKVRGEICTQYVCDIFSIDAGLVSPVTLYNIVTEDLQWKKIGLFENKKPA